MTGVTAQSIVCVFNLSQIDTRKNEKIGLCKVAEVS